MIRILYVEDEVALSAVLSLRLRAAGMSVDTAKDGAMALAMSAARPYDVVLMDCDLGGGMNGIDVGRELRKRGLATRVLMLTGASDLDTKLSAFDMGCDDYLTKPFEMAELIARIRVLMNRATSGELPVVVQPAPNQPVRLLRDTLKLSVHGKQVDLTTTEFKLLRTLEDAKGDLLTADQLCQALWGHSRPHHRKSLYVHVNKVRAKLGAHQGWLETVKGVGYRLTSPDVGPGEARARRPGNS
jgi:DNA-binding response OmpR family regulator